MTDTTQLTLAPSGTDSLNIPLGQVYVTKEAIEAMAEAGVALDDILGEHVTGHGGDGDYDECWDDYHGAALGGDNCSIRDLDEDGDVQIRVETPAHRQATIVSLHTKA